MLRFWFIEFERASSRASISRNQPPTGVRLSVVLTLADDEPLKPSEGRLAGTVSQFHDRARALVKVFAYAFADSEVRNGRE